MTSRKPNILVVENEPIIRNLVVDILTSQGWLVFEADTPTEAMIVCRALKEESLDLLIVADELSPMTGHELADRILAGCPNTKILHLSKMPTLAPAGASLPKPFTPGQLLNAVEGLLNPRMQ